MNALARWFLPLAVLAACATDPFAEATAVGALTHGALEGDAHPAMALLLMEEAVVPSCRCTGTLIASTVVLTDGHCTGEPVEFSGIRGRYESGMQDGENDYPYAGPNALKVASWRITGSTAARPSRSATWA